ncbi:MAG: hypothetical protein P8Q54_14640, partial [Akkermansiaceae bacterium]|nr:hypothetical protein [Akkermansiaceae bacterium]
MKSHVRPNWLNLIMAASLIMTLIGMVPHLYQKHAAKNARTIALSNAKNIAGGLISFRYNPLSPPCIPPKFVLHGLS